MKNNKIKTSITYRLPNSNENIYLEGNTTWTNNWKDIPDSAFLFHLFLGDKFLLVQDLKRVPRQEQLFYFSEIENKDTPRTEYNAAFKAIIAAIESNAFSKIILSRTKTIAHQLKALQVFDSLNSNYANTFNYIISNAEIGTWIGATPERLLTIDDNKISTMALAGTKLPSAEWTKKEFDEQAFVTESILKELEPFCSNVESIGPETIAAGAIQHLHTAIKAELNNDADWSNLLKKLHPTPAVCGTPTVKAKEFIPQNESHERKFYTGFIGIVTPEQKSFFVNLRCMEFYKDSAKLYVGGGIIKESILEDEWMETERKAGTLESILSPFN